MTMYQKDPVCTFAGWQKPGQGVLRDHGLFMTQEMLDEETRIDPTVWLEMDEFTAEEAITSGEYPDDLEECYEMLQGERNEEWLCTPWENAAAQCDPDIKAGENDISKHRGRFEFREPEYCDSLTLEECEFYETHYSVASRDARACAAWRFMRDLLRKRVAAQQAAAHAALPQRKTVVVPVSETNQRKEAPVSKLQLPSDVLLWKGKLYKLESTTIMVLGTRRVTATNFYQVKRRLSEGFAFLKTPPIYTQ